MLDKRDRLGELEGVIERGLTTFVEVGNAIREIRDSRLYKESHDTFEKYCRERWGWSRSYAHRQVEAASTVELLPIGNTPPNEAVARELSPLKGDPETMNRVWGGVVEEHGETPAAKHVKKAVEQAKAAERIRAQLPPATRTVVEGIDPDDCNLPNEPKQLTHLLDASLKHGDERTAETAERVANGEFKTTFDAYPEVKAPELPDPFMSKDERAYYRVIRHVLALGKVDPEIAAREAESAEDAQGAERDAEKIMDWFGRYKAALARRRAELEPGALRRVK